MKSLALVGHYLEILQDSPVGLHHKVVTDSSGAPRFACMVYEDNDTPLQRLNLSPIQAQFPCKRALQDKHTRKRYVDFHVEPRNRLEYQF